MGGRKWTVPCDFSKKWWGARRCFNAGDVLLGHAPSTATTHARLPPRAEVLAYLDDVYVTCDPEDA
eukprot:5818198-Pyramimonas_sp.AAC.1